MMRATCGSLDRFDRASEHRHNRRHRGAHGRPYDPILAIYSAASEEQAGGRGGGHGKAAKSASTAGLPTFQLLVETHLGAAYLANAAAGDSQSMLQSALAAASQLNHVVAFVAGSVFRGALTPEGNAAER